MDTIAKVLGYAVMLCGGFALTVGLCWLAISLAYDRLDKTKRGVAFLRWYRSEAAGKEGE